MKKRIFALLLVVGMLLLLTGCQSAGQQEGAPKPTLAPMTAQPFTELESVYAMYNQATFADTKDALIQRYGEPTEAKTDNGTYYEWKDENGQGFTAVFFDNGKLRSKVVQFEDIRQFAALSGASHMENVSLMKKGMSRDVVEAAFGAEGIEIMRMMTDSGSDGVEQYLLVWVTEGGSVVEALFSGDKDELQQVSYSLAD